MTQSLKSIPFEKKDVSAAVASAIVAIIAAVGFGELSGLGATTGMVTTAILGVTGALMGGAPFMVRSTTGAIVVIVADMVGIIGAAGEEATLHLPLFVALAFCLSALTQWLLGFVHWGKMVFYVPQSIVKGFISGVGLLIIQSQSIKLINGLSVFSLAEWALLVGTVIYMIFGKRVIKRVPAIIIPFIVGLLIQLSGIWQISSISSGASFGDSTYWSYWLNGTYESLSLSWLGSQAFLLDLILLAFAITFISSMDALMIGVAADRMSRKDLNQPDQELKALGIGNALSALVGGLPGSGIMGGTAVNLQAGAKSGYASLIAALFVGLATLFFLPQVLLVPAVVIDGIIIVVGFQLIDFAFIRSVKKVPKNDLVVFFGVLLLTVAVNLVYAILIGFSIASIFFMKRMSDVISNDSEAETLPKRLQKMKTILESASTNHPNMDYVEFKQIKGPLFFGITNRFAESLKELSSETRYVIINFQLVPYIDFSGIDELNRIRRKLLEKDITVYFCGLNEEARNTLVRFNAENESKQKVYRDPEQALLSVFLREEKPEFSRVHVNQVSAFLDMEDEGLDGWSAETIWPENSNLQILDRQGRAMYESSDPIKPWNGKYRNRINCTAGVYTYAFIDDGPDPVLEGVLVLL